ncbi:unnamed protein product, partial [Mesorhabditis spiculigera]
MWQARYLLRRGEIRLRSEQERLEYLVLRRQAELERAQGGVSPGWRRLARLKRHRLRNALRWARTKLLKVDRDASYSTSSTTRTGIPTDCSPTTSKTARNVSSPLTPTMAQTVSTSSTPTTAPTVSSPIITTTATIQPVKENRHEMPLDKNETSFWTRILLLGCAVFPCCRKLPIEECAVPDDVEVLPRTTVIDEKEKHPENAPKLLQPDASNDQERKKQLKEVPHTSAKKKKKNKRARKERRKDKEHKPEKGTDKKAKNRKKRKTKHKVRAAVSSEKFTGPAPLYDEARMANTDLDKSEMLFEGKSAPSYDEPTDCSPTTSKTARNVSSPLTPTMAQTVSTSSTPTTAPTVSSPIITTTATIEPVKVEQEYGMQCLENRHEMPLDKNETSFWTRILLLGCAVFPCCRKLPIEECAVPDDVEVLPRTTVIDEKEKHPENAPKLLQPDASNDQERKKQLKEEPHTSAKKKKKNKRARKERRKDKEHKPEKGTDKKAKNRKKRKTKHKVRAAVSSEKFTGPAPLYDEARMANTNLDEFEMLVEEQPAPSYDEACMIENPDGRVQAAGDARRKKDYDKKTRRAIREGRYLGGHGKVSKEELEEIVEGHIWKARFISLEAKALAAAADKIADEMEIYEQKLAGRKEKIASLKEQLRNKEKELRRKTGKRELDDIDDFVINEYLPTPITATSSPATPLCRDPQHIFPQQKITDPPARTDNNGTAPPSSPGIRTATQLNSTPILTAAARNPQNHHPTAAVVATAPGSRPNKN